VDEKNIWPKGGGKFTSCRPQKKSKTAGEKTNTSQLTQQKTIDRGLKKIKKHRLRDERGVRLLCPDKGDR